MTSSHEFILTILIVAYAAHMLEEYILDWRGWASQLYRRVLTWGLFYNVNAVVIIAGFCAVLIGWKAPHLSLMFPALALADALLLHVGPALLKRRFSPGLLSGVALLAPSSVWTYIGAHSDGVLNTGNLLVSFLGGVVIVLYPFALVWLKPVVVPQSPAGAALASQGARRLCYLAGRRGGGNYMGVNRFHQPIKRVLLVHGYSVFQINSYGRIPALLAPQFAPQNVLLSEYVSLDDAVNCDDLAIALEAQITQKLRLNADDLKETALVCHSTGAIVARRWILNRFARGVSLPSHLVTVAGANHGSSLAQVGRTGIARVFRWVMQDGRSVGERVLADLDYGSTFLWRLNTEWMDAWNNKDLGAQVYCFSFGGDKQGASPLLNIPEFPEVPGWQFLEPGSDSIVRVSGANLNYNLVTAEVGNGTLTSPQRTTPRAAHLVIPRWTHGGVLGGVQSDTDPPFVALRDALQVRSDADYNDLAARWQQQTDDWGRKNSAGVNATIAFRLRDEAGRPINDSWILLQDPGGSANNMSVSLLPHQPIQNETEHCAISFYVKYAEFAQYPSHRVQVEVHSGSPNIAYLRVNYPSPPGTQFVYANEFTYVDFAIPRDVTHTYAIVPFSANPDPNEKWPPFPQI